jgi:hypothetical protein
VRQSDPIEATRVVPASTPSTRTRGPSAAPLATTGAGRSRETLAPQDVAIPPPEESSFAERFDAVFDESFFDHSSLMRRMADLMGPVR